MKYIKNLNFILTYNCNLKCSHCDIWNNKSYDFIDFENFQKICEEKIVNKSYEFYKEKFEFSFSGGEIFLVNDFIKYFEFVKKNFPLSPICITTNGILTERIMGFLDEVYEKENLKINISIDGPEKIHDTQRGIKGSFQKTLKTILLIKKNYPNLLLEAKLTITKTNFKHIKYFTNFCNKLNVFFSFKPYENMVNYTNQTQNIDTNFSKIEIEVIKKQIIGNTDIENQAFYRNKNFFYKIPEYLEKGLTKEEKSICNINEYDIEIMPDLKVYSCILMEPIGNLKENSLQEIITGENLKKQSEKIKSGNCPGCMLMCGSAKTKEIYDKI